ncbi:uncharacterized protein [Clytia hemisphaerica]|uniref:uncharacterized protein n=1 Tax=Clytia hemisphaerica TaxID=252671 RepID=UPI0034D5F25B
MILSNSSHLTGYVIMALVYITTLHGLSVNDVRNQLARELKQSIDYDEYQTFRKRQLGNGLGENPLDRLATGVPKDFECEHMTAPANSKIKCGGRLCLVKCDEGYVSHPKNAFVYRCKVETKEWITLPKGLPLPIPGCIKISDLVPIY